MRTWYHVYPKDKSAPGFGFCIKDGVILSHPERAWIGHNAKVYKPKLIEISKLVVEVAVVNN